MQKNELNGRCSKHLKAFDYQIQLHISLLFNINAKNLLYSIHAISLLLIEK